jgi:hypothetical protein
MRAVNDRARTAGPEINRIYTAAGWQGQFEDAASNGARQVVVRGASDHLLHIRTMLALNQRAENMGFEIYRVYTAAGYQGLFEDAENNEERHEVVRRASSHLLHVRAMHNVNERARTAGPEIYGVYLAAGYQGLFEDAWTDTERHEITQRASDHLLHIREMHIVNERARAAGPEINMIYTATGYQGQFEDARSNEERQAVAERARVLLQNLRNSLAPRE